MDYKQLLQDVIAALLEEEKDSTEGGVYDINQVVFEVFEDYDLTDEEMEDLGIEA